MTWWPTTWCALHVNNNTQSKGWRRKEMTPKSKYGILFEKRQICSKTKSNKLSKRLRWLGPEKECIRSPPRRGRYWEMDFPIPSEFWWSTDILSASIFLQEVDQKILPCGQGRIDSVKINPSLLMMRECVWLPWRSISLFVITRNIRIREFWIWLFDLFSFPRWSNTQLDLGPRGFNSSGWWRWW